MGIKFLTFHNQLVADLATDNEQDDLGLLHIIQRPEIADTKFKLCQWLGRSRLIARVAVVGCPVRRARIAASKVRCSRFGRARK
jgi:hypothetical protein